MCDLISSHCFMFFVLIFFQKSSSPSHLLFLCSTVTATVPIFWWSMENECMSGKIAPLLSILGFWLSLIRAPLTYGGWAFCLRGLPLVWSVNMKGTIYCGVRAWWKGELSCHWTQFHAFQWNSIHAGIKHQEITGGCTVSLLHLFHCYKDITISSK